MLTLIDLVNQLNEYFRVPLFKDYCPNGLQVEGKENIKVIATAVSASLNVIHEAVRRNADVLICHHGLFWEKQSPVVSGVKKEKLASLLGSQMSLLSYHLPLDAHREIGNNWKAAIDMGWQDLRPFYQIGNEWLGVQGKVAKCSREEFKEQLEVYYGQKAVAALGGKEYVESAALISGGAYRQMEDAAKLGIDCYITGNFDEPAWHMAFEEKINFFALGHAATEKVGPKALAEFIRNTQGIEVFFIEEFNPF